MRSVPAPRQRCPKQITQRHVSCRTAHRHAGRTPIRTRLARGIHRAARGRDRPRGVDAVPADVPVDRIGAALPEERERTCCERDRIHGVTASGDGRVPLSKQRANAKRLERRGSRRRSRGLPRCTMQHVAECDAAWPAPIGVHGRRLAFHRRASVVLRPCGRRRILSPRSARPSPLSSSRRGSEATCGACQAAVGPRRAGRGDPAVAGTNDASGIVADRARARAPSGAPLLGNGLEVEHLLDAG